MTQNQEISKAKLKKDQVYKSNQQAIFSNLQYSIFSNILKNTSDSLFQRQSNSMAKSNQLIDHLNISKKRQMQTTTDTQSHNSFFSDFMPRIIRYQSQRKLISRKSPKIDPMDFCYRKCLEQVEENCSKSVFNNVKNLIKEMKRIMKVLIECESKQRKYELKLMGCQKIQQQNLILTERLKQAKKQIKKQSQRIKILEEKNNKLPFQNHLKQQISIIDSSILDLIRNYINEKQKKISLKAQQIKNIQNNVEEILQNQIFQDGCEKCCNFLKKIKASIIEYKTYLVHENSYIDTIYKKYKKLIFRYQ